MTFPGCTTLAEAEAYADRQLQRYDRRLLRVRAEQDFYQSLVDRAPRPADWRLESQKRLEQLATRIIRKRDAFMVRMIGTLDPVHYQ